MNLPDLSSSDTAPAWCPGCGNFPLLETFNAAIGESDLDPDKVVLVSGIGQAAKLPHYTAQPFNVFTGLHGRALPAAFGIKCANHELEVIITSGDGDMYGEGGNHLLHAIRRNVRRGGRGQSISASSAGAVFCSRGMAAGRGRRQSVAQLGSGCGPAIHRLSPSSSVFLPPTAEGMWLLCGCYRDLWLLCGCQKRGAERRRTAQLSTEMAPRAGLEPTTYGLEVRNIKLTSPKSTVNC